MKKLIVFATIAALGATACKTETTEMKPSMPQTEMTKEPTEAVKPAAAGPAWINLDKMGLKVQMPAGAKAEDTSGDAPGYTVAPEDYSYTVMIATVTEAYASSYEAAQEEVKKTNGFKSFTKNEKTADGWVMEFEAESMMDKSPLYGVVVRKKIGDKAVECTRNESAKENRDNVAKACASLAKI